MARNKAKTKQLLMRYVNTASDLAESVKRNIIKNGLIDDKTVLALNEFIIASNAISDLTDELNKDNLKLN